MFVYVLLVAAAVGTLAAPQGSPQGDSAPHDAVAVDAASHQPVVEIVQQDSSVNADGTFNYSYEAANGIKVQQTGTLKKNPNQAQARIGEDVAGDDDAGNGDINVIEGSYSYTAPDGTVITLKYIADELGFRPVGDHLPTPPPAPEYVARLLAALPQDGGAEGHSAPSGADASNGRQPLIPQVEEPTAPENIFPQ